MSPVAAEELLMFIKEGMTQSADDPFPIPLPDPKDPEGFQPLLFSNRPLAYDQRDSKVLRSVSQNLRRVLCHRFYCTFALGFWSHTFLKSTCTDFDGGLVNNTEPGSVMWGH